jgi:hypothetical protein
MRILWLYKYLRSYDFDNWLHLKFVEWMHKHPDVEVMCYGPDIHMGYPHLTNLKYNPSLTAQDIKKHFDYDVMIFNTKSRMFMEYNPHENVAYKQWLPPGFTSVDVPRIVIEEDYHYEKDDKWYVDQKMDLILQRHWSQSLRQQQVPMQWLPFSVDVETFHPGPERRAPRICFAGSTNVTAYSIRNNAMEMLKRHNMIDIFSRKEKIGPKYPQCLREWVSHLCCSSVYKLSSAKMFEIMASGSVLLTSENDDLPLLFPEGSYATYKPDCSNVVAAAREVLSNKGRRDDIVGKGLAAINARHTHKQRVDDLLKIINDLRR